MILVAVDTMDEDIDIEEHDLLDNPLIKSIFPDISVIKKEIECYYNAGKSNLNLFFLVKLSLYFLFLGVFVVHLV